MDNRVIEEVVLLIKRNRWQLVNERIHRKALKFELLYYPINHYFK